jgi:hypothetical protein
MRQGEADFVDRGAWIALALSRDPLHSQAREQWELLRGAGAKLHSSVPVNGRKPFTSPARKDSSMRVARFGAVLGIFSTRGSAQAVHRRRYQLCDYEARANSARIRVRSSLCRRRLRALQLGLSRNGVQPGSDRHHQLEPEYDLPHRRPLACRSRMCLVDARW